jgi:hypothetical protein
MQHFTAMSWRTLFSDHVELDKARNKADGVISVMDSCVIARTVVFSFIAE